MSAIALRVGAVSGPDAERNRRPRIATIDAAIAKYRTPTSASRARVSSTSIPFRSAVAVSCFRSPSAS